MKPARIRLWDLPTRIFHWLLLLLVVAAVISGEIGGNAIDCHGKIGLVIAGLLAFRVVWGFVGTFSARFVHFFPTPARLRAYLRGEWHGVGHNPLGALSVFALLGVLGFQVASGVFANDDIAFNGPLYSLVDKALSDRLTGLHHLSAKLLLAFVALHVGAILFYVHVRKDNLLRPMIDGWKEVPAESVETLPKRRGGGLIALLLALLLALGAVYGASGVWIVTPPPPAAPAAPAW